MAIDVEELKDQVAAQKRRRRTEASPEKVRMTMAGQEFMVLERDQKDFEKLGYKLAPADPVEGTKAGEYREGKYEKPKAKAAA